jgi:hypothetical protein
MKFIVAYDISSDSKRNKADDKLKNILVNYTYSMIKNGHKKPGMQLVVGKICVVGDYKFWMKRGITKRWHP